MADQITLTQQPVVANGNTIYMNLQDAIDIHAYDQLDLYIQLLKLDATSVTVDILTSMQNTTDDVSVSPSPWVSAGSASISAEGWSTLSLPTSGKVLLRYVRWKVAPTGGNAKATVYINGLARRVG